MSNTKKQNSYKTIKEIFTEMTKAYTQVEERLEKQKKQMTGKGRKLLLEWWLKRVHVLHDSLQQSLDNGSEEFLETWIQYIPKMQIIDAFEKPLNQENPDQDSVVSACKNAHNELISFVKSIRDQTKVESVQKQLSSYITLLEKEKSSFELSEKDLSKM